MIKAAFFDIDGTLLTQNRILPSTARALRLLKEKGILCVISTGRHALQVGKLPVIVIPYDGYISLNGQLCVDHEMNIFCADPIPQGDRRALINLFENREKAVTIHMRNRIYFNHINEGTGRMIQEQPDVFSIVDTLPDGEIYMTSVVGGAEVEAEINALLSESKTTRWSDRGFDVIAGNGGKVQGMQAFLNRRGIAPEETIAFGDGENDIGMLTFAGIGVAMGNAMEEVKASADYVTGDIERDGLYQAVAKFCL